MKWVKWAVIALYVAMIGVDAYQVYRIQFIRHESDFVVCLAAAHDLRDGTNPYILTAVAPYNTLDNARPYIYPIFLAWVWIPFTFLTAVVASYVWYAISLVMMFAALLVCAKLVGIRTRTERWQI